MDFSQSLSEWAKDKPLSILQLDPADRAVLKIADERDAIQKKTFTKWLNKHLKKHWRYLEVNRHIDDLFEDLRDGHNLISLLEVLSGELLPRERGRMRFHQLQNVQSALDFLKNRNIRLVNIRPEDIVDGNPKLTLGLIWTIILHFQISDIITGLADETVTAREALLKWAQRTTECYPGVRIADFTNSWKDGLAFNAIIHRNRPDLLDFRSLRTRPAKDNLELAFSLAEKEFGITRLLDPEDVDTPEPDEKSLITYISSMYDVFPEPPSYHPFADDEKNRKIEEYKELARNFQHWVHESLQVFRNQKMCNSLIDMKNLLLESSKFRSDEIPKRQRDKQRLTHLYQEIQKMCPDSGRAEFPKNLQLEEIEKSWNSITSALQERDKKIRDEICRLEKLQRLAEKVNRELKRCDGKLDDAERRIKEEEKRMQRLHFVDAKHNCDQIESDLKHIDELLKSLKKDITSLDEKNFNQTTDLKLRLENLRERYQNLKSAFQSQLLLPLSSCSERVEEKKMKTRLVTTEKITEGNRSMLSLKEYIEWIERKQKRLTQLEFGLDYQAIKSNLEQMKLENKAIEQYGKKIAVCTSQKNLLMESDDIGLCEDIENKYKDLLEYCSQKIGDGEILLDFVQSASKELKWMADKEEVEVTRDWSTKNLNLVELEHHQEKLTGDLEKREIQFNAVQNRGESLLLQKHPASNCIESYLSNMQSQWSWLLQLTLCLEIHLKHAQAYHQFFREARECEQWIRKAEEKLNTTFSKSIFSIDEGERYLKQMQDLKEDLTRYNDIINCLVQRSFEILPLKQRRVQPSKSLSVISICNYKSPNIAVSKDDKCTLKDVSHKTMWKVSAAGLEGLVPGVCFIIPPPNPEATELSQSLKKRYEGILNLWTLKQKKLRQNLILATVKVVKGWDASQFRSMDIVQRESIMKALNADIQKLLSEGSNSEPILVKLREEMDYCNTLFSTLMKNVSEEESEKSPKSAGRKLSDNILSLQNILNEKEKFLRNKLTAPITWDMDLLENLVIEHKDFEIGLRNLDDQITQIAQAFKSANRKTTVLQMKYDTLVQSWDKIWELSNIYIEKLKLVEVGIHRLNEAIQSVSNIEVQLASCDNMPSNMKDLHNVHDTILSFQADMQQSQTVIDDVQESARKLRDLVQRIRPKQANHSDINKFENDVKKLSARWDSAKSQIVERLRSCDASSELLQTYKSKMEKDSIWLSETSVKVNSLKTVKRMTTKEIELTVEPVMNLYSSVSERSSSLEETNVLGARYIREAKIYDLRLKHYKENLEEEHPSLDASLQKKKTITSGAEEVKKELEVLNQKYSTIVQNILNYLEQLREKFSTEQKQKWMSFTSKAVPVSLKTFSNVIDQVSCTEAAVVDGAPNLKHTLQVQEKISMYSKVKSNADSVPADSAVENSVLKKLDKVPRFPEYRNTRSCVSSEELLSQNICMVRGIYNPKTEKMVTLHEAVEQNILSFETGEFTDLRTGRKMSLQEAVVKGFIDKAFYDRISSKCGIYYPGNKDELSLVEAVQKNLYDIKKGTLLNPQDCKPVTLTDAFHLGVIKKMGIKSLINMKLIKTANLSVAEAIEKEFLEPKSGKFREPLTNLTINFKDSVNKGYINLISEVDPECGLSLAEAIDRNIIHDQSGQIFDQDSGEKYTLDEAVAKGILRSDVPEIVDKQNLELIPLNIALSRQILLAQCGKYIDNVTLQQCTFKEAREKNLILKPLTLKDALEMGIIDDNGVLDPLSNQKISILEAFSSGILDCEAKYIVDPHSRELLSLPEALQRGIILPNCKYFDTESLQELTFSSAVDKGFITSVTHKMIFDIEGIKDVESNELISFNTSLERKIIDLNKEIFVDTLTSERMSFDDAVSRGFIQHQIYDMLCKPIGIKEGSKELNLIECCKMDLIDYKSGQLKDPKTKKTLYIKEAVHKGVITHEGAALLKGLLNITVTMATVTRTITRYVNAPNDSVEVNDNIGTQAIIEEVKDLLGKHTSDQVLTSEKEKDTVSTTHVKSVTKHEILSSQKEDSIKSNQITEKHSLLPVMKKVLVKNVENNVELTSADTGVSLVDAKSFDSSSDKQHSSSAYTDIKPVNKSSEKIPTFAKGVSKSKVPKGLFIDQHQAKYSVLNKDMKSRANQSVQVLELPPDGWYLKEAIDKKFFDPEAGLFTVPGTDRLVSFEETIKMEIINSKSASVLVPKSKQTVPLDSALEMRILDSTGHYNSKTGTVITMKKAIEQNLLILDETIAVEKSKQLSGCTTTGLVSSYVQSVDQKIDPNQNDSGSSVLEGNIFETKNVMKLGLSSFKANEQVDSKTRIADSISLRKVKQGDQIILQKITRKMLSPSDAFMEGFIDKNAADALSQAFIKKNKRGNAVRIQERDKNLINFKQGAVIHYQKGTEVSVSDALDSGFIDKETGRLLIPIGRSLSFSEAFNRGLIDKASQKIIHPENGNLLSIEEALICEVINPYSFYVDPSTSSLTVEEAIKRGIIDNKNGNVTSPHGCFSLIEAVQKNLFKSPEYKLKSPPLLALTFPTALQYGYIDIHSKEYINPITNERQPLQKAFDNADLMVIPVQPQREYFLLDDALSKKLINSKKCTFRHPVTGEVTDLREAMRCGLLVTKPVRLTITPSSITTHTETQVENTSFPNADMKNQIFNISKEFNTENMSLNLSLSNGALDFDSGTFYDKITERSYPITEAIQLKILQPLHIVKESRPGEQYSLQQVFQELYDEQSKMFIEPNSRNLVSFQYLVKNNFIDLESLIYDVNESRILTLNECLSMNIIDAESGQYIVKSTGNKINAIEASKCGLLLFLGSPLLSALPSSVNPNLSSKAPAELISTEHRVTHTRPSSLPLETTVLESHLSAKVKSISSVKSTEKPFKVTKNQFNDICDSHTSNEKSSKIEQHEQYDSDGKIIHKISETSEKFNTTKFITVEPVTKSFLSGNESLQSPSQYKKVHSKDTSFDKDFPILQTDFVTEIVHSVPEDEKLALEIPEYSSSSAQLAKTSLTSLKEQSSANKKESKRKESPYEQSSSSPKRVESKRNETSHKDVCNVKNMSSPKAMHSPGKSKFSLNQSIKLDNSQSTVVDSEVESVLAKTARLSSLSKQTDSHSDTTEHHKNAKLSPKEIETNIASIIETESICKMDSVSRIQSTGVSSEYVLKQDAFLPMIPDSTVKQSVLVSQHTTTVSKQLDSSPEKTDPLSKQSVPLLSKDNSSAKLTDFITKKTGAPSKSAESPTKRAVSPTKRAASPTKNENFLVKIENTAKPDYSKREVSSPKNAVSPNKRENSPTKRADSPVEEAVSPTKRTGSPVKRANSPTRAADALKQNVDFPIKKTEPANKIAQRVDSPVKVIESQKGTPMTPAEKIESLSKVIDFTVERKDSSIKLKSSGLADSVDKQRETLTKNADFSKREGSPSKRVESPTKRIESPTKSAESPTKRAESPIKSTELLTI